MGFGTGQYLTVDDVTNKQVQSFYLVWDRGYVGSGLSRSNLQARVLEQTNGIVNVSNTTQDVITWDNNSADAYKKYGWYMDLVIGTNASDKKGERVVHQPLFRSSEHDGVVAVFSSRIPAVTDPCAPGGSSKVYAAPILTGLAATQPVVDFNEDGAIDSDDAGIGIELDDLINDPNILGDRIYASKSHELGVEVIETDFGDDNVRTGRLGWRELIDE